MAVEFRKAVLENGLTLVGEIDPEARTAACGFFVKTGARDEAGPLMGVSHFLEHMMFKGTEKRSADDVNRDFDDLGAQYNAYTSSEITCFYASTLPEHIYSAAEILSDILRPALREDDFNTEKNVILEEIAMYKDNPFWVLYERSMEEYYAEHPLAHRVLGTDDTIKAMACEAMRAYFNDRYSADNTTVALAGRMDFDAMAEQLGGVCSAWARTGAMRDNGAPSCRERDFELRDAKVHRGYLLMLSPAPSLQDDRRYAAMLLAQVLGDPGNSRLHWELVETGIAEEAQAAYDPRDGCGDFYVYASGDPSRLVEMEKIASREIERVMETTTEDDLERLRNKLATGVTLAGERPGGRMQRLGRLWTYLGSYTTLEDELARINAVTLEDLRAVYEAFPFRPRTVGRMLPG